MPVADICLMYLSWLNVLIHGHDILENTELEIAVGVTAVRQWRKCARGQTED